MTWAEGAAMGLIGAVLAVADPFALWLGHITLGYGAPPGWVYYAVWLIAFDILIGPIGRPR